jgi:hypothetical protein
LAVTLVALLTFTLHGLAVPVHAPPQLVKAEPLAGVAVNATVEPLA